MDGRTWTGRDENTRDLDLEGPRIKHYGRYPMAGVRHLQCVRGW